MLYDFFIGACYALFGTIFVCLTLIIAAATVATLRKMWKQQ